MPRLFTGLELPEAVVSQIAAARGGVVGARWLEPEDYHVTLRFIGDVDTRTAHDVAETLEDIRRPSASIRFDGLSWFGGDKPRAIVARIKAEAALIELQAEQERRLRRVGLPPETRKYTPHVTSRDFAAFDRAPSPTTSPPAAPSQSIRSQRSICPVLGPRRNGRRALCRRGGLPAGLGVTAFACEEISPPDTSETDRAMNLAISGRSVRLDPRDPAFFNDPYPAYAAIRAEAPAFFWKDYGFWCFASHADVSELLRDRRFGRQIPHVMSREDLGWPEPKPHLAAFDALERHSILELEPPEHTRLRNLINRAFVSRQVEKLAPRIAALAHERIDAFEARGSADLIAEFATPIPVAVIADLLGVPRELGPQMLDWSHRMVAMYQFGVTRAVEESAAEASAAFADFIRSYARKRRSDLRDDLISQLLAAESEGGRLSQDELVTTSILVLNAGHEATVHGLGNGAKAMLERNVDPREAFASERGPRRDGRGIATDRCAAPSLHPLRARGCGVCRRRLGKGEKIGLLLGAANRDPGRFPQPDAFDPERDPNPHVTFGAGIHFCVGAPLARLEMAIALSILFDRLPGLRLAEKPRYRDAFHFHGLEALKVRWR